MAPFIRDKSEMAAEARRDVLRRVADAPIEPAIRRLSRSMNRRYIDLWKTLPADSTVDEVIRNFFIRQPVLWLN